VKTNGKHKSPDRLPDFKNTSSHMRLFVNRPAWYLPVAMPCAPVKVAMSTMMSAFKSFLA
jgi:hypothetical protein